VTTPDTFNVLFVCLGNICRSPTAEHLFRARVNDLPFIRVSSLGTRAMDGFGMPAEAQLVAKSRGATGVENHLSRRVSRDDLLAADLVLCSDREQRRLVLELLPTRLRATFTLPEFARYAAMLSARGGTQSLISSGGPVETLRSLTKLASEQRATAPSSNPPGADDIADPFGKATEDYERAANEISDSLEVIETLMRATLTTEA
jgi:protein-tyrosine phosphatase